MLLIKIDHTEEIINRVKTHKTDHQMPAI